MAKKLPPLKNSLGRVSVSGNKPGSEAHVVIANVVDFFLREVVLEPGI
jgi:hypothetical protein